MGETGCDMWGKGGERLNFFVDLDVLTLSGGEGVLSLGEARLGDRRIEGEVHRGLCAIGPNRGG